MSDLRHIKAKLVPAVLLSLAVSGCSSLGLGESDYSCPFDEAGAGCMSTSEVYEATNNGRSLTSSGERDAGKGGAGGMLDDFGYVTAQLASKPTPLRSPAQVMRIWVAPREDKNGDLVMSGFVFTEIEPRKWVVGEPSQRTSPNLYSLQKHN